MLKSKKKIVIFTQYSKKIGYGHYYRSNLIKEKLSNKYDCELKANKSINQTKIFIKKNKANLIIFDLKYYNKKLFQNQKNYIAFDNKKNFSDNLVNINPLTFLKKRYYGPSWFPYPDDFFLKKKIKTKKNNYILLIAQGATDAFNNINKILKCISYLDNKKIRVCKIKIPKNFKIKNKILNNIKIKKITKTKYASSIFKNIDLAITGCGNISYEVSFFGIPSVFVSSEREEIKRGKILQKNGHGKFFNPTNVEGIAKELNKLANNYNYYQKIKKKKIKVFKKNGLKNILKLIDRFV
tara:strand:- start:62728 stop:63615 length:888 start_codon:yes stop_codon:yes gene_type:complete